MLSRPQGRIKRGSLGVPRYQKRSSHGPVPIHNLLDTNQKISTQRITRFEAKRIWGRVAPVFAEKHVMLSDGLVLMTPGEALRDCMRHSSKPERTKVDYTI